MKEQISDFQAINAILATARRWEQDARYSSEEAMLDVARIMDRVAGIAEPDDVR